MAGVRLLSLSGAEPVQAQIGNLFPATQVGWGVDYAYLQVVNESGATQATLRAWFLVLDPGGVQVSLAVVDNTPRALTYIYPSPSPPGSWSAPTSYAGGMALASLATGQKLLIAIKRDSTTGAAAHPEANSVIVSSS